MRRYIVERSYVYVEKVRAVMHTYIYIQHIRNDSKLTVVSILTDIH